MTPSAVTHKRRPSSQCPAWARYSAPHSHEAERIADELFAAIERIGQVHPFAKGMDIAAPQIGIARSAAIVMPPDDAPAVILLNPRITKRSAETDEQYEGSLSFFDVRGLVPRPLKVTVEAISLTGETTTTVYERGLAASSTTKSTTLTGCCTRLACERESSPSQWSSTGRPAAPGLTSRPRHSFR
ncbi:peptide deformylase [Streptomyces sp. NPDC017248]|uniref:peptide deformylase n=1 Tax=unclassified Streptomyces TaxID=2593676 RepID=UPI003789029A